MTYEISSENVGIYSKPARMSNIVFFSKVPQQLGASYFKKSVNFFQQNNYNSDIIPEYDARHLLV